jgi:hypothetical protein
MEEKYEIIDLGFFMRSDELFNFYKLFDEFKVLSLIPIILSIVYNMFF